MPETTLSLKDITKSYPGSGQVLKSVSLDVMGGEIFVILGPSGSGKSTLMNIIAGVLQPDSGSVYLQGEDITDQPPYKRDITLIWQHLELFPHMTARKNILFPLRMKNTPQKEQEEKLQEMLQFVELEGFEERYPKELSGGQQQRVALARGLISEPSLLLLDEPLSDLDRLLWERMLVDLKKLQREIGISFIYVTHNQVEALTLGDRLGICKDGRLEQVGTPEEIYNTPKTEFVARFVGASNRFEGEITEIKDEIAKVKTELSSKPFTVRVYDRQVKKKDKTIIYVRPEELKIGSSAKKTQNIVQGKIISTYFKGFTVDYLVRLANGQEILATAPSSGLKFKDGDTIPVGWETHHAKSFKKV